VCVANCPCFCRGSVGSYLEVDLKLADESHPSSYITGARRTIYGALGPFPFRKKRVKPFLADIVKSCDNHPLLVTQQRGENVPHSQAVGLEMGAHTHPATGAPLVVELHLNAARQTGWMRRLQRQ
jgi:hypothetical protein